MCVMILLYKKGLILALTNISDMNQSASIGFTVNFRWLCDYNWVAMNAIFNAPMTTRTIRFTVNKSDSFAYYSWANVQNYCNQDMRTSSLTLRFSWTLSCRFHHKKRAWRRVLSSDYFLIIWHLHFCNKIEVNVNSTSFTCIVLE